jgi:hypothetical protein
MLLILLPSTWSAVGWGAAAAALLGLMPTASAATAAAAGASGLTCELQQLET